MEKLIPLTTAVVGDASGGIATNPGKTLLQKKFILILLNLNFILGKGSNVGGKAPSFSERWKYLTRNIPKVGKPIEILVGPPIDVTRIFNLFYFVLFHFPGLFLFCIFILIILFYFMFYF